MLTALVVGFASLALLAVGASQQAARQRDIAISARLIIQSQILGDSNPALARLLGVAAWDISPASDARYAMLAAAAGQQDPGQRRRRWNGALGLRRPWWARLPAQPSDR